MKAYRVELRPGQVVQCCGCYKMAGDPVIADLDGHAFIDYYCAPCAEVFNVKPSE